MCIAVSIGRTEKRGKEEKEKKRTSGAAARSHQFISVSAFNASSLYHTTPLIMLNQLLSSTSCDRKFLKLRDSATFDRSLRHLSGAHFSIHSLTHTPKFTGAQILSSVLIQVFTHVTHTIGNTHTNTHICLSLGEHSVRFPIRNIPLLLSFCKTLNEFQCI